MESKRVGLGPRIVAVFFDLLAVIVLAFVLFYPISWLMERLGFLGFSVDTTAGAWAVIIYHLWFTAVLYSLIEGFAGASPGKRLLSLRVRTADGQRAGLGRRLGRWFLKGMILLVVPPFGLTESDLLVYPFLALAAVSFLGFFFVLGKKKQTLHDRLSSTAVFRLKDLA